MPFYYSVLAEHLEGSIKKDILFEMLHWFNKTEQMKHPKLRAELRPNEEWFFITLILTTNKTSYISIPQKCQNDKRCTAYKKFKPGLHLNKVMTITEHACDYVLKRVLKLSSYRLQIFPVKYEYLQSLQLCEDQGIRGKL